MLLMIIKICKVSPEILGTCATDKLVVFINSTPLLRPPIIIITIWHIWRVGASQSVSSDVGARKDSLYGSFIEVDIVDGELIIMS